MELENSHIAVIGLGYVGLPLAHLFAKKYKVIGYDVNVTRVSEINSGNDSTLEVSKDDLQEVLANFRTTNNGLFCSSEVKDIKDCNIFIITVPTPVDSNNRPDLTPLLKASKDVGQVLKKGDLVIYESTVYPGVTEEECVPVLEEISSLTFNIDFFAGYSPERINPGDQEHKIETILKVTSGSTPEIANKVDQLYKSVIKAGTHLAPSIKVAEASKVIENSQRDINIAFVNELAKIFGLMDINTADVLEAAKTKWNFLPFTPGLVGGHCIGVDPYYLAQKAEEFGYHPGIILAGRRMNEGMGEYVGSQIIKLMIERDIKIKNAKVLILGITFKENCPDVRNTRVIDVIQSLIEYGTQVTIVDPWADREEVKREYQVDSLKNVPDEKFDAIVLAVAHEEFKEIDLSNYKTANSVVYDVKSFLPKGIADKTL
jgi:UDP-N-acetyl-D-galactosamine dehydrogenase